MFDKKKSTSGNVKYGPKSNYTQLSFNNVCLLSTAINKSLVMSIIISINFWTVHKQYFAQIDLLL